VQPRCTDTPPFFRPSLSQDLLAALAAVSKEYAAHGGPFFFGAAPSLPDVLLFPFLARLSVLKHYRGFEVPAEAPEYAALRRCVRGDEAAVVWASRSGAGLL
jgi:glutathione S-transferase